MIKSVNDCSQICYHPQVTLIACRILRCWKESKLKLIGDGGNLDGERCWMDDGPMMKQLIWFDSIMEYSQSKDVMKKEILVTLLVNAMQKRKNSQWLYDGK